MDYFFWAKEFGWPPDVVRRQRRRDLHGLETVSEVWHEIAEANRKAAQRKASR